MNNMDGWIDGLTRLRSLSEPLGNNIKNSSLSCLSLCFNPSLASSRKGKRPPPLLTFLHDHLTYYFFSGWYYVLRIFGKFPPFLQVNKKCDDDVEQKRGKSGSRVSTRETE